ncbi:hypothetical protein CTP10_R66920 (plasmid) [Cupriavidus sp. P-10]|nr:hypothetical protein CTP10_R66920 [Cupriavidus sp. P-10]
MSRAPQERRFAAAPGDAHALAVEHGQRQRHVIMTASALAHRCGDDSFEVDKPYHHTHCVNCEAMLVDPLVTDSCQTITLSFDNIFLSTFYQFEQVPHPRKQAAFE